MTLTTADIHWIAGFLEGEGSFQYRHGITISGPQVQLWPLLKLQTLLGGSIIDHGSNGKPNHQDCHIWRLHGVTARGLAMTLYPLMSPRRQSQIKHVLWLWHIARRPGHPRRERTHCKHGHPYDLFNTRWMALKNGSIIRRCKQCLSEASHRWYVETKRHTPPRIRKKATHCKRGHAFTPENTRYAQRHGYTIRECRHCARLLQKKYRDEKRSASK